MMKKMNVKSTTFSSFKLLYTSLILLCSMVCQAQFYDNIHIADFNNFANGKKNQPTLVDYNEDGKLDLMTTSGNNLKIWRKATDGFNPTGNIQNQFVPMSIQIQGTNNNNIPFGACVWADLDNDGDHDLIVTRSFQSKLGIYLQVQENTTTNTIEFKDESNLANTHIPNAPSGVIHKTRVAVADLNKDGKLDLLVTRYSNEDAATYQEPALPAILLLQKSGNTLGFDKHSEFGAFLSHGAKFCDYDNNGLLDVYMGSYRAHKNALFEWIPPVWGVVHDGFFSEAPEIQTQLRKGHSNSPTWAHCTGVEWLDFDNDGDFDLYVSNLKHPGFNSGASELFENVNGSLTVTNQQDLGLLETFSSSLSHHAQQSVSFDYDGDGDVDIFQPRTAQGNCSSELDADRSRLLWNRLNSEDFLSFAVLSGEYVDTWGAVAGDCDNDGDLDMFTVANHWGNYGTCQDASVSGLRYLRNHFSTTNTFLKIKLEGTGANKLTAGIGAEIYIDNNDGGIMSRLVEISTSGQKSGTGYIKNFGLGQWDSRDAIVFVKWPDSPANKVERHVISSTQINSGNLVTLVRGTNNNNHVQRDFYCEDGRANTASSSTYTYNTNYMLHRYTVTAPGETIVKWQYQSKPRGTSQKYTGHWADFNSTAKSLGILYPRKWDIKFRALVKKPAVGWNPAEYCYSEVATGYGNQSYAGGKLDGTPLEADTPGLATEGRKISISPNPTTDLINITTDEFGITQKIEVFSSTGARVYSADVTGSNTQNHEISLRDLPAGVYFVNVHLFDGAMTVEKIIKQ